MSNFDTPSKEDEPASPRLSAVMQSFSVTVAPAYLSWGQLSIMDVHALDEHAFTGHGALVLSAARQMVERCMSSSVSVLPDSPAPIHHVPSSPFFKPPKVVVQPFEAV